MKKNASTYGAAKERKYNEFYSSKGKGEFKKTYSTPSSHDEAQKHESSGRANQFAIDPNSWSSFGVNDRYEDTYELSNSMGTEISQLTDKTKSQPSGSKKFSNYNFDDREIKATGSYKFEEEKEDDYQDDFEEATKDAKQMTWVLDNYKRVVSGDIQTYGEMSLKKTGYGDFSPISEAASADEFDTATMIGMKNAKEKQNLIDYFGEDQFDIIYEYLLEARRNDVSDSVIQSQWKKFVGSSNKEALSMWFKLDMLAFKEIYNN